MKLLDWRKWTKDKKLCREWLNGYIKKGTLRKIKLSKELYLKKAIHNLDFANWVKEKHNDELPELFGEERFYDWVINAYYYAIYHAALALISAKGYSSKSHNATLCAVIWFYYHQQRKLDEEDIELIKETIDREDIEIITETKDLRERASYDVSVSFEFRLVEKAKNNAVYFINKVKKILE
ncbi:MAG: hypothetical protein DRP18_02960 [Candidatus Aenigmatarchaeota archaeon]|nr:MAG: hypothetical protein DRP18_02960 [Candidatus Aenigmarchaeota archaeon]